MISFLIAANISFAAIFFAGAWVLIEEKYRVGAMLALAAVVTNTLSALALIQQI